MASKEERKAIDEYVKSHNPEDIPLFVILFILGVLFIGGVIATNYFLPGIRDDVKRSDFCAIIAATDPKNKSIDKGKYDSFCKSKTEK